MEAVAQQAKGHPHVCLKSAGKMVAPIVAKVPNGDTVEILADEDGEYIRVRWHSREGFAKVANLQITAALPEIESGQRNAILISELLSSAVQVQEPTEAEEVACKLSQQEVARIFVDHVPGVSSLLFREKPGVYCLGHITSTYVNGLAKYRDTPLHTHLTGLFRRIVHYGQENQPNASSYLREVAEAFMSCQAVQARTLEKIGLQIQGITLDFRGLVVAMASEYKSIALKMLVAEKNQQLNTTHGVHYENRLIADIGPRLGMDSGAIRMAQLDEHARMRFKCLTEEERDAGADRCRELFDLDTFLCALVAEVNSFSADSDPNSLPRQFLDWISEHLTQKHIVFDEETCSNVDVGQPLLVAILEELFLGGPHAGHSETYRGQPLRELFVKQLIPAGCIGISPCVLP